MKITNRNIPILLLFSLLLLSLPAFAEKDSDKMWTTLETASGTSTFVINLPSDGCMAIIGEVNGKNKTEKIWGPR